MKIELDKRSLFALASDTRLEILKALLTNRRTVSQLAEIVNVDKAAVHRHLKKLEEGEFVARNEDHGFVYYALTWKSRDILNPNDKTKIVIMLSSSLICLLALTVIISMAMQPQPSLTSTNNYPADQQGGSQATSPTSFDNHSVYQQNVTQGAGQDTKINEGASPSSLDLGTIVLAAVLGMTAFVFVLSSYLIWKKPKQRGGEEIEDKLEDAPLTQNDD